MKDLPTQNTPLISVIIPTLNEETVIRSTLETLNQTTKTSDVEVIVVDGGSKDRTIEQASLLARVIISLPGRARQMNLGASFASGQILLFLHADTFLPPNAFQLIQQTLVSPRYCGGCFRHALDHTGIYYRLISQMSNLRARWPGIIYGDQAPFVRKSTFETLGGFREQEILEDGDFTWRMRKIGHVKLLKASAVTSARRWEHLGCWKTIFLMWAIALGYWCGISPTRLKRLYPDIR